MVSINLTSIMERKIQADEIYQMAMAVRVLRDTFPASNSGESKFFAIKYPHAKWFVYCTDHDLWKSKRFTRFLAEVREVIEVPFAVSFYNASHTKIELDNMVARKHAVIGRSWSPEQNFLRNLVKVGSK